MKKQIEQALGNFRQFKVIIMNNEQALAVFMSPQQLNVVLANTKGEEGKYFEEMLESLLKTFDTMPKTYEQDGKGDEAVAYLHYFTGGFDWYITEKDMEDPQHQAFGLVCMQVSEIGYISIEELKANNVELDFHFEPKTLREIKLERQS